MTEAACSECEGNDAWGCLNGEIYGYCTSELCGGLCEYEGTCGCGCHLNEETT